MRRYASKKYTYTPTQGVKSDFETLLQKFTETGTVRFQSFADIWKEMKFSKYCAGRQTLREVREFVEECLKIAMQFWLPPSSFQVRAGALYLLYGLYNFQIVTPKAKIRVTPENWTSITEFQTLSREQQHLDIDYVFQKLKLDRAFQFVATPSEFNPYDYRDDVEGKSLPDSLKDDESLLSELYSSQVLNQLAAVHDQYHKMKVALAGNDDGDEPDTSLNIINNGLIQNIYRTLKSHREKQSHAPGSQVKSTHTFFSAQQG